MSDKTETARECIHRIVGEWYLHADIGNGYISEKAGTELSDSLIAALEERERERDKWKAERDEMKRDLARTLDERHELLQGMRGVIKERDTLKEQLAQEKQFRAMDQRSCEFAIGRAEKAEKLLAEAVRLLERGRNTLRDLSSLANVNSGTRRLLIAVGDAFSEFLLARVKGSEGQCSVGPEEGTLDMSKCQYQPGYSELVAEQKAIQEDLQKLQSDPIKDLCALLKENNMGFVFWVCDNPEHRRVTWEHKKEGSVATCDVCGKKSSLIQTGPSALREVPTTGDDNPTGEPHRQGPEGSTPSGPASLIYCPNCLLTIGKWKEGV